MRQVIFSPVLELEEVLEPYSSQWDEWIHTKHCFLSKKEITVVECFRKYHHHHEAAKHLNLTRARVQQLYRRAITKLRCKTAIFHQSNGEQILEKAGLICRTSEEKFLEAPFHEHHLTTRLYHALRSLHYPNLKELLQCYSSKELKQFRRFGKKSLAEFEELLKDNNCLHLLRKE